MAFSWPRMRQAPTGRGKNTRGPVPVENPSNSQWRFLFPSCSCHALHEYSLSLKVLVCASLTGKPKGHFPNSVFPRGALQMGPVFAKGLPFNPKRGAFVKRRHPSWCLHLGVCLRVHVFSFSLRKPKRNAIVCVCVCVQIPILRHTQSPFELPEETNSKAQKGTWMVGYNRGLDPLQSWSHNLLP